MANTTSNLANLLELIHQQGYDHPETPGRLLAMAESRLRLLARARLRGFPHLGRWVQTDDVLQNVMFRLSQSLTRIKPESVRQFFGLAALQIKRSLLDLQKSIYGPNGIGTRHHTDGHDQSPIQRADQAVSPLEELVRFNELTESLEPHLKELVDLIFIHGLTQEEASKIIGVSHRTAKRWWLEARVALGEKLGHQKDSQSPEEPVENNS
jgi:RNA polymerase sigma-70 factor (ECF subfamily)